MLTPQSNSRYNDWLSGGWRNLSLAEKRDLLKTLIDYGDRQYYHWREFIDVHFAYLNLKDFSIPQIHFWDWVWSIRPGVRPHPFVALWARGAAKSTSAELAAVMVGQTRRRPYIVYVSGSQDLADRHVQSIGGLLEKAGIERAVNKYGSSRGWRRDRLRTENFTIDALGLDTGARGIRVDEDRPGLIVLDDVDKLHDTDQAVQKKLATLTETILPAGSNDAAILLVQNLIHRKSIASMLVRGEADFLQDRILSGPFPALTDFSYDIVDGIIQIQGTPMWAGQDLAACKDFIRTWGLRAFLRECQHQVGEAENGVWKQEFIDAFRVTDFPTLDRIVVGVDPPGKQKTECGIVCNGRSYLGLVPHCYTLEDASHAGTPDEWANTVVATFRKWKADMVVAEQNFGGDMVYATIKHIDPNIPIKLVSASRGKVPRAEPCAAVCQEGREHHVGRFVRLEDEQCNWIPGTGMLSPNRMDAHVWGMIDLLGIGADAEDWIDKSRTMSTGMPIPIAPQPAIHRRVTLDDIARQIGDAQPPKDHPLGGGARGIG